MFTYQDYEGAGDRLGMMLQAVRQYRASPGFRQGLAARAYFRGENETVGRKTVLKARRLQYRDRDGLRRSRCITEDVVGNRIAGGFLYRFVCQQNQYLLQNGAVLPPEIKKQLGFGFDQALEQLGEQALLCGVSWGFWNLDHLEVIEAVRDCLSGFVPLMDEMTGRLRAGIQFWQLEAGRPLYLRLFEESGVTVYRMDKKGGIETVSPRRGYGRDWDRLPVFPLWANSEHRSEFTPSIRSKIDAYDRILSDFADNLDRANDVYWVLNNFGGGVEDICELLEQINRVKAVACIGDGSGTGATAEPHTIEVPYAARHTALTLLEKALYADYMALDTAALTGGSLTNVAIRAACANLDLKCDRYEWQVFRFVQSLLTMLGCPTDSIRFNRQVISNDLETIEAIYRMRQDIDRATALRLNPLIQPEEAERLTAPDQKGENHGRKRDPHPRRGSPGTGGHDLDSGDIAGHDGGGDQCILGAGA